MERVPKALNVVMCYLSGEYTAILKSWYSVQSYVLEWSASRPVSQGVNAGGIKFFPRLSNRQIKPPPNFPTVWYVLFAHVYK